mmetsp:Transcript_24002/g.57200  ORF Transcript_24002/g.57200 Transcript_24002/m.57200 type:complete len:264 (-) Transcript_24002:116-907(-)
MMFQAPTGWRPLGSAGGNGLTRKSPDLGCPRLVNRASTARRVPPCVLSRMPCSASITSSRRSRPGDRGAPPSASRISRSRRLAAFLDALSLRGVTASTPRSAMSSTTLRACAALSGAYFRCLVTHMLSVVKGGMPLISPDLAQYRSHEVSLMASSFSSPSPLPPTRRRWNPGSSACPVSASCLRTCASNLPQTTSGRAEERTNPSLVPCPPPPSWLGLGQSQPAALSLSNREHCSCHLTSLLHCMSTPSIQQCIAPGGRTDVS